VTLLADKSGKGTSAREAALNALVRYEQDLAYLNLALPPLVKTLSEVEKALAVKLANGTIQHLNTIDWILQLYSRTELNSYTPWLRNLLRVSVYQIIYLERVPVYAVVNEAVKLARRYGHRGVAGLTNAVLRKIAVEAAALPWPDPDSEPDLYLSLRFSIPQWLIRRNMARYGFAETEQWCRANQLKPPLTLRPNRLRISADELIVRLGEEDIAARSESAVPGILAVRAGSEKVARSKAFTAGLMTIQGESSYLIAPLLRPQPEEILVDLCSAPGGKTTHLAELQQDQGKIFAVELHESRAQLVEKAKARLGLKSITTIVADGRKLENQNLPVADAVLVDAPCSGLGVIRRLPEIKWRRREKDLLNFQRLQLELLSAGSRLLRPGGRLLYSVCTTEPEETTMVADAFNQAHSAFSPEPLNPLLPAELQPHFKAAVSITLQPHRHNLDGFFIALWTRLL
jgi:16S rRNA (cytosine967-C5)-methyltransferase